MCANRCRKPALSSFNLKELEKLFRYRVLKMLLRKGRITEEFVRMMDGWRHSGFNVFAGERIQPREKKSLENLAAYLIRSSFSQRRMEDLPQEAKVLYQSNTVPSRGADNMRGVLFVDTQSRYLYTLPVSKQVLAHYGNINVEILD